MWIIILAVVVAMMVLAAVERWLTRTRSGWATWVLPVALAVASVVFTVITLLFTAMGDVSGGTLAYNVVLLLVVYNLPTLIVVLEHLRQKDRQATAEQAREDSRFLE